MCFCSSLPTEELFLFSWDNDMMYCRQYLLWSHLKVDQQSRVKPKLRFNMHYVWLLDKAGLKWSLRLRNWLVTYRATAVSTVTAKYIKPVSMICQWHKWHYPFYVDDTHIYIGKIPNETWQKLLLNWKLVWYWCLDEFNMQMVNHELKHQLKVSDLIQLQAGEKKSM